MVRDDPKTSRIENPEAAGTIPKGGLPERIYRAGNPNPANLRPRPGDGGRLSFRDSLSNPRPLQPGQRPVFEPGEPYFAVDPSRLPPGTVFPDNDSPGHVSVIGASPEAIKNAVVEREKFLGD
jgi:hypothetical protein